MGLGRNSWPLTAIRQLADAFLECADGRKKSPAFEARWLNLCGFCLRPGFGFPGDDFRIEQARRIYAGGLQYANQVQCEIDWWIFWGRVAGGSIAISRRISTSGSRAVPAAARQQEAAAHQQQPAARDVAHRRQPGTAAHPDQDRARRGAGSQVSRRARRAKPSSGASRASARASCSTGPSIRWCRPPRSRAGWKRCCLRPPRPKRWRRSRAAPTIRRAIFPPPRATPYDRSWRPSHARSVARHFRRRRRARRTHARPHLRRRVAVGTGAIARCGAGLINTPTRHGYLRIVVHEPPGPLQRGCMNVC